MRRNAAFRKRKGREICALHLQFAHYDLQSNTQHLVQLYGCMDAPAHFEQCLQACDFLLKIERLVNVHDFDRKSIEEIRAAACSGQSSETALNAYFLNQIWQRSKFHTQHGNVVFLPEALRCHSNQIGRFDAAGAKALETIEFAGLAARFDDTVGEKYHAITGPEAKVNLVVGGVGCYTQG